MDLDDLAVTIYVALMPSLDRQPVSDRCFHGSPSPGGYVPGLSVPSRAAEIQGSLAGPRIGLIAM
jgi:hypothetical protein